ncbi:class I SAM-dependent methyltransferase [Synechococcus sp. PCC 7336]|uniref:class I SAM-dependent methyltransferase n=1 Tax=Synechococcus sp. PCC 7336 TaxID=195250 RepID=UPI00034C7013|nr:class I SAM-dependent methyltransferase [Synechococcus sp. PCC 7336]
MQVVPNFADLASHSFEENAYKAIQWSKNYFGVLHKLTSSRASRFLADVTELPQQFLGGQASSSPQKAAAKVSDSTLQLVRQRYEQLLAVDYRDAEAGYYPKSLLFDLPWLDFARTYPLVWLDLLSIRDRISRKQHQEFSPDIDTEGYPQYYLQNFHHQTDGYLSDRSAELYDLQVELLFGGSADAMRRRIIRPIVEIAGTKPDKFTRILDLACGTGRTLRMLRAAFPSAQLFGTDLSPAYLRKANQLLSERPGELPQLLQANAEALPYADATFDLVTSVFLFHELPGNARQNALNETSRVLKPGGTIAICDSIQLGDSPELLESMENFASTFHEPYYRDYIRDDLGDRLQAANCEVLNVSTHFVSRYTLARKLA